MRIRIINYSNRGIFCIDVPEYFSVLELKKQLLLKEKGIGELIYKGIKLEDYDTLEDYNIEDGDLIRIIPHCVRAGVETENKDYSSNINAVNKRENIGREYYYHIIGSNDGTVWGNDIFTDDSNIAKAAVLKGKCKLGEKTIVGIKMIEGKSSYSSSNNNGVSSITYGSWPASYIFI